MSDQETVIESAASPEQQADAIKIGWKPPDQFKGTPAKFVDADVYLERADTILPFVRDQNKRLAGDLTDLRTRLESVVGENAGLKKRLEDIDMENSTRLAREVKRVREETQAELEEALESGNHKLAAKLTREVAKLESVEEAPPKKETKEALHIDPRDQQAIADWNAWADEHEFEKWTIREKAEFRAAGEELRRLGNRNVGKLFADDIASALEREKKVERNESKVEAGKGSGAPRGGKKTGYDSLSKEERDVCDSDQRNFVGAGKRFAKVEDYRAHWAKVYQEQA